MLNSCLFLCYILVMFYIYRHIRIDEQVPFYIGKGTLKKGINPYARSYDSFHRSLHWKSIAAKGYEVEIMMEFDDEEECFAKEREFILLYGRRDLKTGTLVNFTGGGEGTSNLSDEARLGRSVTGKKRYQEEVVWNKGTPATEEAKKKMSSFQKKRYEAEVIWNKGIPRTEESRRKASEALKGRPSHWKGKTNSSTSKKIVNIETGAVYHSIKEAALKEEISISTLKSYLHGRYTNKTPLLYLTDYEKQKDTPQSVSFQFHR